MRRLNNQGQFIPIAAMVMFTAVVFLIAVVNVYKVSRAKLKVQNLADAAALNIASQMASSLNKVSDLNEWMNHFVEVSPLGPSKPGDIPDCVNVADGLPPLACAENPTKSKRLHRFGAKGDAIAYASLVKTINKSQELFIATYNNFIGAGTGSNSTISSNSSLQSILIGDIPELSEPGTQVAVWNFQGGASASQNSQPVGTQTSSLNMAGMQPIKFKVHDVVVTYKTEIPIMNIPGPDITKSLGQLLGGNGAVAPIGWMELDSNLTPQLNVKTAQGPNQRMGVGVRVRRPVKVLNGMTIMVDAQSTAFIVQGSGKLAEMTLDRTSGAMRPVFKPTYWVKLGGT